MRPGGTPSLGGAGTVRTRPAWACHPAGGTRRVGRTRGRSDPPRSAPGTRIPVKLHRRVCLILTEDAVLAEELLARKKMAQDVVGRLTDRTLLVRPGRIDSVVEELQRMGHTPQVVGR